MHAAYALHVEEFRSLGLGFEEAIERVEELLLPVAEFRASQNRRAFAHLLKQAEGR